MDPLGGCAPPSKASESFRSRLRSRPLAYREQQLGVAVEFCPQCNHDVTMHFFERDYPDYCFCQMSDCDCTCDWFKSEAGH